MAASWDYKGFGGWRTYDQYGNPLQDASGDQGYAKAGIGLDYCKQICEQDGNCKGVEYVDQGGGNTSCEIHYDKFAYCDTRGGTKTTVGKDGCWVKAACPTQTWKWISIGIAGQPEVRILKPYEYLIASPNLTSNQTFEVTTHSDCSMSLQSRDNGKYVKDDATKYHTLASGATLADAARYNVYGNADQTYSFQNQATQGWLYEDPAWWIYKNGIDRINPMTHFNVTVHQSK